ncbi:MAG: hypothetical protein U5R30_05190 [Deltaproteobacteria bacterium]|nr:hypothetical protein [Deltaproteobacteria bacterium]
MHPAVLGGVAKPLLEKFAAVDRDLRGRRPDDQVGGIISAVKTIKTKKGETMAFVTVEDMQGAVEAIVFSALYAGAGDLIAADNAILIQGRLQKDEQSIKVIADVIIPMNKAEETWTASIHFHLEMTRTDRDVLERLQETLLQYPGSCRAFLHLRDPQGTDTVISLPERIKLQAGSLLTREVNRLLGYHAVETVCSAATAVSNAGSNRNGHKGYGSNGRY